MPVGLSLLFQRGGQLFCGLTRRRGRRRRGRSRGGGRREGGVGGRGAAVAAAVGTRLLLLLLLGAIVGSLAVQRTLDLVQCRFGIGRPLS